MSKLSILPNIRQIWKCYHSKNPRINFGIDIIGSNAAIRYPKPNNLRPEWTNKPYKYTRINNSESFTNDKFSITIENMGANVRGLVTKLPDQIVDGIGIKSKEIIFN